MATVEDVQEVSSMMTRWNTTASPPNGSFELRLPWFILLCIISCVGSVGNAFIIGAVCLQKRLRVRGNVFIINLAVADLIVTSYIMPMGLATSRFTLPPFDDTLCDFNGFLVMCTCGVSTQSLMMVAIERYVTICKLHWYRRLFNTKMIAFLVIFCWIYSAIWSLQGWTGWTQYVYGEHVFLCLFSGPYSLSYDICLAVFGMILPMLALCFCYIKIFQIVWKSRQALMAYRKASPTKSSNIMRNSEERRMKRETDLAMTLFTIVIFFVLFWAMAAVVLPMSAIWPDMPKILYTISVWVALSNSCVNSLVYGALNKNFRQGYRLFFFWLFCLRSCQKCRKRHSGDTSTDKSRSPDTSSTQTSPNKKYSTALTNHNKQNTIELPMKDNSTTHVTTNDQPARLLNSVQYVHLDEGQKLDFYTSPIVGASIISDRGVIETRL